MKIADSPSSTFAARRMKRSDTYFCVVNIQIPQELETHITH